MNPSLASVQDELSALERDGLRRSLRVVEPAAGGRWRVAGHDDVLVACSNDYLGLARDPRLATAAADAATSEGTGSGAARLVTGTRPAHATLERSVAAFCGTEAALTFASGYAANVAVLGALLGPQDLAISDALNHASLIDGLRLSGAKRRIVPHRDVNAVRNALADRVRFRRVAIVTEGLYSMEGDVAPLAEYAELADSLGALLVVDDAHGTGVLGATGRGALEACGVCATADVVRIGTFGKAFGASGAFLAATHDVCDLVLQSGRGFVFTTAPGPPAVAAAEAGLAIACAEPQRREQCLALAARLRNGLRARGIDVPDVAGPIVPIVLGDAGRAVAAAAWLLDRHGILATAIRPPTVPEQTARLRLTTSAAMTETDVDRIASAVAESLA